MSRTAGRHQKPSQSCYGRPAGRRRHRKLSPVASALQHKPARIAAAVAGSTLLASAGAPVVAHWPGSAARPDNLDGAQALTSSGSGARPQAGAGLPAGSGSTWYDQNEWSRVPVAKVTAAEITAARLAAEQRAAAARHAAASQLAAQRQPPSAQPAPAAGSGYSNPFRDVADLQAQRVDMGVDFGGSGPVFAIGDGVITNATSTSSGWPGGGWITYRLTSGPDAGLVVYVAEDVTPAVQVGQTVTSSTVIANMFNGADGIETGWATPDGSTAESQMTAAGGIGGGGPFPTKVGLSFDALLQSLGVPAGSDAGQAGNGALPAGYPAS